MLGRSQLLSSIIRILFTNIHNFQPQIVPLIYPLLARDSIFVRSIIPLSLAFSQFLIVQYLLLRQPSIFGWILASASNVPIFPGAKSSSRDNFFLGTD